VWGLLPIYWKALEDLPALVVVAYRVLWASAATALLLTVTRRWREVTPVLRSPRHVVALAAGALLIGLNWLVFIWAVDVERLLEASFGYYLNPLVNVLLGVLVLGERLTRAQAFAVVLAAVGVARLAADHGGLPWVSLVLAVSFGLYGLMHKLAPVMPLVSLMIESALLVPLAAVYLGWRAWQGDGGLGWDDPVTAVLVPLSGPLTILPLGCFAAAAARLRLSTIGLFQYIAPTLGVVLAVALYGEPFAEAEVVALACIWGALALYSFDAFRRG